MSVKINMSDNLYDFVYLSDETWLSLQYRAENGDPTLDKEILYQDDTHLKIKTWDNRSHPCPQQLPDEVLSVEETEALIRSFLEKENGPLAHIEVQTSIRTSAYRDPMHFSYYPHGQMDSKECLETVASEMFGDMAYDDETYGAQCGDWRLESGIIMEKGNHIGSYYRDNDTIVIEECSNAKALDVLSKQASAFFTVEEPDVSPKKNDIGFER